MSLMSIKRGVAAPCFAEDPMALVDLAVEAEQAGFDGFFLWDHMTWSDDGLGGHRRPVGGAVGHRGANRAHHRGPADHAGLPAAPVGARPADRHPRPAGQRAHHLRRRPGRARPRRLRLFVEETGDRPGPDARRGPRLDVPAVERRRGRFPRRVLPGRAGALHSDPAQRHRIPVWVGGVLPSTAGMRRAARWDGAVPIRYDSAGLARPSARDIAFVRDLAVERGATSTVLTSSSGPRWRGTRLPSRRSSPAYEKAGTTWWIESARPGRDDDWYGGLRTRISAGGPGRRRS